MTTSILKAATTAGIFIVAAGCENSFGGFFMSVKKALSSAAWAPRLMAICNFLGILFAPLWVIPVFTYANCPQWTLAFKIVYHLFFVAFDSFLCFKTWIVARKRSVVGILGILLLMNRLGFGVFDWIRSYGFTSPDTGACLYHQDQIPAFGFLLADLLVDIFCTTTTIYSAYVDSGDVGSNLQMLYEVLIADNVLRSLLILIVNVGVIYFAGYGALNTSSSANDAELLLLMPAVLFYVYSLAVNAEYYWMAVRNNIVKIAHESRDEDMKH